MYLQLDVSISIFHSIPRWVLKTDLLRLLIPANFFNVSKTFAKARLNSIQRLSVYLKIFASQNSPSWRVAVARFLGNRCCKFWVVWRQRTKFHQPSRMAIVRKKIQWGLVLNYLDNLIDYFFFVLSLGIGMDSCVIPLKQKDQYLIQTTDFFFPLIEDPYLMVALELRFGFRLIFSNCFLRVE